MNSIECILLIGRKKNTQIISQEEYLKFHFFFQFLNKKMFEYIYSHDFCREITDHYNNLIKKYAENNFKTSLCSYNERLIATLQRSVHAFLCLYFPKSHYLLCLIWLTITSLFFKVNIYLCINKIIDHCIYFCVHDIS